MATILINQFGGEQPSVSPRALPATSAQTHTNLSLQTNEFRPLADHATVTAVTSGTQSLYHFDNANATTWITSTAKRSYVRGQIHGDDTQRSYYSEDDGTGYLRTLDNTGADRLVGVPAPAKPTVTFAEVPVMFLNDLAESIRAAIESMENGVSGEPDSRYGVATSTIFGGPRSNYGLNWFSELDPVYSNQYWSLFAALTPARMEVLKLNASTLLGAPTAANAYAPLVCLPYTFRQDISLTTSLSAIVNPRTTSRALTDAQVASIKGSIENYFDPDRYALTERTELDALVQEFSYLTLTYVPLAYGTKPTEPTKPTVAEWVRTADVVDGTLQTGVTTRATAWTDYDVAMATYKTALETYNESLRTADADVARVHARIKEIQSRCSELTKTIESLGTALWDSIRLDMGYGFIKGLLYALGGSEELPNVDAERVFEYRYYLVTFVNDRGEESAPSPVSDLLKVEQYGTKTITMPTVPSGRNISHWRIYRTATGSGSTEYLYVEGPATAGIPIATTSYTDSVLSDALAEPVPSATWLEPELGLKNLIGLPNGTMAAFSGNTISFCEPYRPFAWPVEYQVTVENPIVGMAVFGQTIFVGTKGNPYFVSGSDPASMSAVKLETPQSCASSRSIVAVQGGVLYASPDGLCVADGSGVKVVTQGIYSREDWQILTPSTMFATSHENIYYLFHGAGCITFDMAASRVGKITGLTAVTAAYVDPVSDALFIVDGANIKKLHHGTGKLTGIWRSAIFQLPAQAPFAWLKVLGDQSAETVATVRWYADGTLRHTFTVTSTTPVRMPVGRWLEHEVEIESKARITSVMLAGSTQELQAQ